MTDKNLIAAFEIIANSGEGWFKGSMPKEILLKAEKYLNVKFPFSFSEFLLEKGNGIFKGLEFYGLVCDDFTRGPVPDAIWLTMNQRKSAGLDKDLILICESPDYFFAIDTGQSTNGESPVVNVIPGVSKKEYKIEAPSYGLFFLNEIKIRL